MGRGTSSRPGRGFSRAFFSRDTRTVARDLIGSYLCRKEFCGGWTYGRVVETEAYRGEDDPACHAAAGRTPRTRVMYGAPGRSYVYFTYGMHHLLNVVTEPSGYPAAVLIRALEPLGGIEEMEGRRGGVKPRDLTSGPGRLCQALGLDLAWNDQSMIRGPLVLTRGPGPRGPVTSGPRVGIRRGRDRLWRFWESSSRYVSRG